MARVNIRDLKANLSANSNPMEELEPEEVELVAAGILRMPVESLPTDFWDFGSLEISPEDLIRAISEDRDETGNTFLYNPRSRFV